MGNSGKNSNTSQFFFTFAPAPVCDGKHVIFGEVSAGMSVLDDVESIAGSSTEVPRVPVTITACGLHDSSTMPSAGYWLNVPSDAFLGYTPVFYAFPRVLVLAPSAAIGDRFKRAAGGVAFCVFEVVVGATVEELALAMGTEEGSKKADGSDLVVIAKVLAPAKDAEWAVGRAEKIEVGVPADVGGWLERFKELGWTLDNRLSS